MVPYRYKPIDSNQIRLLELFPHEKHLRGRISHHNIDGTLGPDPWNSIRIPKYRALSHHWDPKPKQSDDLPILVIQEDDARYEIRIRPSLRAALEAIRHKMRDPKWSPFCWVDAVCIDQRSSEDKDKQLPIMGDIYVAAECVIVWLGKLEPIMQTAIHFIRQLQDIENLKKFMTEKEYTEQWRSLAMMTRNPWFTRLWIVQEIAAARDAILLVGDEIVPWDDFAGALSLFVSQLEAVRTMLAQAGTFAKDRNFLGDIKLSGANILVENQGVVLRKRADGDVAEHLKSLEGLLTSLSMFEVTDPHDAVYAILWLSSDANQGKLRPRISSHRFNVSTPRLQKVLAREALDTPVEHQQGPQVPQVQLERFDVGGGHVRRVSTEEMLSPTSSVHEKSRSRRHSTSGQYLQVPAQEAEQLQAEQNAPQETGITVNYQQSVYDLCKSVLEHIFRTTKRLDIICYHWAPGPQRQDPDAHPPRPEDEEAHPTWLLHTKKDTYAKRKPDTRYISKAVRRVNADPLIGRPGSKPRPYLACGRTRAEEVKIEGRVLHAYGYALATIADLGGTALNGVIPYDWREKLQWTDSSKSPPDRFWRTLVADKGPDGQRPPPRFQLACKWAFLLGPDDANVDLEEVRNDGDGEAPLKEFIDCCIPAVWNRKLFLSQQCRDVPGSNFVGIGPSEARIGDVICILWGCAVPVLLRPIRNSPSDNRLKRPCPRNGLTVKVDIAGQPSVDYTFVGECFVCDMMNGEVFHYADTHDISIQDFYIH